MASSYLTRFYQSITHIINQAPCVPAVDTPKKQAVLLRVAVLEPGISCEPCLNMLRSRKVYRMRNEKSGPQEHSTERDRTWGPVDQDVPGGASNRAKNYECGGIRCSSPWAGCLKTLTLAWGITSMLFSMLRECRLGQQRLVLSNLSKEEGARHQIIFFIVSRYRKNENGGHSLGYVWRISVSTI